MYVQGCGICALCKMLNGVTVYTVDRLVPGIVTNECCELVAKAVNAIRAVLLCGRGIMGITVVREINTVNYINTGIYVYAVYILCKILH